MAADMCRGTQGVSVFYCFDRLITVTKVAKKHFFLASAARRTDDFLLVVITRRPMRLLDLPPELLVHIVRCLCTADHLRCVLDCRRLCKFLKLELEVVRQEVDARRLRFSPELTTGEDLSDDNRSIAPRVALDPVTHSVAHAAAGILPITGRSSWRICIDVCHNDQASHIVVGVCDAACENSWGVHLYNGELCRGTAKNIANPRAPTPEHFAGVHFARRNIANLRGAALGGSVEVTVDHNRGTLAFRINRAGEAPGTYTLAIVGPSSSGGFLPATRLRPWVAAWQPGDRVSILGWL